MRILVTGASGFIGRPLVRRLVKEGHEVRTFSRRPDAIEGAVPFKGDLADANRVAEAVEGCDRVYHLGALARAWAPDPAEYERVNVDGTRHVLEACRKSGVPRVVHVSSVMAIGPTDGFVADESTPLSPAPLSHYQRTKQMSETLAAGFARDGLPVVTASPSLVYGPATGRRRVSFNRFLQDFVRGRPVVIPGDGSQRMNCVYLEDVVEGLVLAMERGRPGEKYILGGVNISLADLAGLVNRLAGTHRRILHIPFWAARLAGLAEWVRARLTGGTPLITWSSVETYRHSWTYSSARAASEMGYHPRPLEDGLPPTMRWLREN